MQAPLSLKQQREQMAFFLREKRTNDEFLKKEQRKDQLHQLKMADASTKVAANMKEQGIKGAAIMTPDVPPMPPAIVAPAPQVNSGFAPGVTGNTWSGEGDTVPAMLTPGEAVIPAPAAQHPDNKPVIEALVNAGRAANRGYSDGSVNTKQYADGTESVYPDRALRIAPTPLEVFQNKVFGVESSNNVNAQNPNSSAVGLGQFVEGTWKGMQKNYPEKYGNIEFGSEAFKDPNIQRQATIDLANENVNRLRKSGINIDSASDYYAAHFLGYSDAKKVYEAKPDKKLSKVLSKSVIDSNPQLKDMTVSDFHNWTRSKMGLSNEEVPKMASPLAEVMPPVASNMPSTNNLRDQDINQASSFLIDPTQQQTSAIPKPQEWTTQSISDNTGTVEQVTAPSIKENQQQVLGGVPPITKEEQQQIINEPIIVPSTSGSVQSLVKEEPISADEQQFMDAFNSRLGQPEVVAPLRTLNVNAPENQTQEGLASNLMGWAKDTFGDMFDSKDLARFAVVLAGGLLSGGSWGGSLRFAGVDALKSSDARRAAEAARGAESAKNTRERYEQIRTKVLDGMSNATEESRNQAVDIMNQVAGKSPAEALPYMEKALATLRKGETAAKPSAPTQGYMYSNGRQVRVTYRYNGDTPEIQTAPGQWVPATGQVESVSDYDSFVNNLQKDIEGKVTPQLQKAFGEDYNSTANARKAAIDISLLRAQMPRMDRESFIKIAENAIKASIEESVATGDPGLTEEGLRKAVYGNAVIQLRKSNADMYTYKDNKGKVKPVSARYQSIIGDKYTSMLEQLRVSNPNATLGDVSNMLEKKYKELPKEEKAKYEQVAKSPDNMVSGFVLWLSQQ